MKSLFVYVPEDLYERFKIKVIKDKTTIKEATLTLLGIYVGEGKNDENDRAIEVEKEDTRRNVKSDEEKGK